MWLRYYGSLREGVSPIRRGVDPPPSIKCELFSDKILKILSIT